MVGTMRWFNRDKGVGVILTEAGPVAVEAEGFEPDELPAGRCAGRRVTFSRAGEGEDARAIGVRFDDRAEPRRARLRQGRSARSM